MVDWDAEYRDEQRRNQASSSRRNTSDDDEDGDIQMAPPVRRQQPDFLENTEPETNLQQLVRHWMNERHCPDILPAQEVLLAHLLDHIRRQSDTVQLLRVDPSTSDDEHFRIMLVQTEVERVKFIVRSYVCTRLFKIEKYARFISVNADIQSRLTVAERDHAIRHANLTDEHLRLSVLQSLPPSQSLLDDSPILLPPMVTEPDKSRPVFAYALRQCSVQLPNVTKETTLETGQIVLAPFYTLEELVLQNLVEII